MTLSTPPVYIACINDVPGVAAANTYLSAFNPPGSGRVHIAIQSFVSTYSAGNTAVASSLLNFRTTSATGGTLLPANRIGKFRTDWPDPVSQIRVNNPTVTILTGDAVLFPFPPVISVGTGENSASVGNPPGASFVMAPGEGLIYRSLAGDVDQVWNITYVWTEVEP